MELTSCDYEYLKGEWDGPRGAAFNVVSEDCREAGWGSYGQPTPKGYEAIQQYEVELWGFKIGNPC